MLDVEHTTTLLEAAGLIWNPDDKIFESLTDGARWTLVDNNNGTTLAEPVAAVAGGKGVHAVENGSDTDMLAVVNSHKLEEDEEKLRGILENPSQNNRSAETREIRGKRIKTVQGVPRYDRVAVFYSFDRRTRVSGAKRSSWLLGFIVVILRWVLDIEFAVPFGAYHHVIVCFKNQIARAKFFGEVGIPLA